MAIGGIKRRLDRLETAAGKVGAFEERIRRSAAAFNVDSDRLLALTKGHEAKWSLSISDEGTVMITVPEFCFIRDLLTGAGLWDWH